MYILISKYEIIDYLYTSDQADQLAIFYLLYSHISDVTLSESKKDRKSPPGKPASDNYLFKLFMYKC